VLGLGEISREAVDREGLVTFFSCDPKEKSYEIDELRHGVFTYCLLEAIKGGQCPTVALLDKYLDSEVPKLNKKYGKNLQRPWLVIKPQDKSELTVFYNALAIRDNDQKYDSLIKALADLYADDVIDL